MGGKTKEGRPSPPGVGTRVQRPRTLLLRAGQIRMVGHLTSRRRLRLPLQSPLALKFSSVDCRPTHRPAPNSPFWSFQLVSPPLTVLSKIHQFASFPQQHKKQANRAQPKKNYLTFPGPPFFVCVKVYLLH